MSLRLTSLVETGLVLLLLFVSGCAPSFTAADAETRLVLKVGEPGAAVDSDQLERVRAVVEGRLAATEAVWQFLVEAREPDELIVLSRKLTDEQIAEVKDILSRPGTLEFALLANTRDHAELIAAAQASEGAPAADEPPKSAWIPLALDSDGQPVTLSTHDSIVVRETEYDGQARTEALVVFDPPERRVTADLLKRAFRDFGSKGTPTLGFEFNTRGTYLMKRLTSESLPAADGFKRRLAVILDGRLHSAPTINVEIGGRGVLEGNFTAAEVDRMASSLNGGRLPAPVRFVEVLDVGGT